MDKEKLSELMWKAEKYLDSLQTYNALPEDGDEDYWTPQERANEFKKATSLLDEIVMEYNSL